MPALDDHLADRALLLEARSYACYLTSQVDEAMTARQAALETWTKLGNVRKVGENRCHLATLLWAQARIVEAEREAEAAVALMEQVADGPELAMAQATLARLLGPTLRDDEVFRLGEQAIALAQRFGDTESLIDARITVGEAMLARSKIESGLHQLDLGMRLASAAGLDGVAARAYISLGHGFAECGRSDIATEHFERGIRFCAERDLDLGAEGSILHLPYSELEQEVYRLALEIEGARGLVRRPGPAIGWAMFFFKSMSATIAGGTSEIQRNTIGERLLGLPR